MLGVALIVFREVLEAALIIGIVFAATRGIAARTRFIGAGIGLGVLGAVLVALGVERISAAADGMGQELFNATVLFVATAMLCWHTVWMSRHGREAAHASRALGASVAAGSRPLYALVLVIGLAVLREGSEVVLFLFGLVASGSANKAGLLAGGLLGVLAGVTAGAVIGRGLLSIPLRHLFAVTGTLIALLAAGMASQGMALLVQAGYVSRFTDVIWDTTAFVSDASLLGQTLRALVGYTAAPLLVQLMAYAGTLAVLSLLVILTRGTGAPRRIAVGRVVKSLCVLGACGLLAAPRAADANFKVYSPYVELGEWELEFRADDTLDGDRSRDGAQGFLYEIGYSPTSRWHTALFVEQEREPGGSLETSELAWENIFQLTEPGEYWLDVGAYVEYAKGLFHEGDQALEWKILLEKTIGNWTFTANPVFEQEFPGREATPGVEFGYAWGTYYRLMPALEPGFEAYGEIGEVTNSEAFDDQTHRLGPVVRGRVGAGTNGKLAYNVGYLFGASDNAPDGTFKVELEYELRF